MNLVSGRGQLRSIKSGSNPTLAFLVRDLRKTFGIRQKKLTQRLRVSFPTVNRWKSGYSKSSPLTLRQIEDLLLELGHKGANLLRQNFGSEKE